MAQQEGQMRGGDAASHSPDPRTTHEKTRTAIATGGGLRRDRGGAALPARGRGGRSGSKLGATNRGRGVCG